MACLFCESVKVHPAVIPRATHYNNKTFDYVQCGNCELVYIDPLPGEDDYKKMYSADYHEAFYFGGKEPNFGYLLPEFEKYRNTSTILDYGCGDAGLLRYFHAKGYKCYGAEFADTLVQNLNTKYPGITFFTIDDLWKNKADQQYNFIHLGDVLEHLEKPIDFVKDLTLKLEKDNGVMVFEGPLENNKNFGFLCRYITSWITNKLKPNAKSSHVPYHITFSNAKNQRAFFKHCGLEELKFEVFETPWPYPESPKGGLGNFIKYSIGYVSKKLSKIIGSNYGNRFIYIGKKQF